MKLLGADIAIQRLAVLSNSSGQNQVGAVSHNIAQTIRAIGLALAVLGVLPVNQPLLRQLLHEDIRVKDSGFVFAKDHGVMLAVPSDLHIQQLRDVGQGQIGGRSEEHTSELQSQR